MIDGIVRACTHNGDWIKGYASEDPSKLPPLLAVAAGLAVWFALLKYYPL